MRNAQLTKDKILSISASLFNTKGFKATSISDITNATGLTKGAIYRHFDDKQHLEESTYDYISTELTKRFAEVVKSKNDAPGKLVALCGFFSDYLHSPLIAGGCPVLNAGVESDDTNPELNIKVKNLVDVLQESLEKIVSNGRRYGQIKPNTDPAVFATVFIASLEGAVLLSKIRKNTKDMNRVITHLKLYIQSVSME